MTGLDCPALATLQGLRSGSSSLGPEFVARVLPGFYSSMAEPLDLYRCVEAAAGTRCPGGIPATCTGLLNNRACTDCPSGRHWDRSEGHCQECTPWQQVGWIFRSCSNASWPGDGLLHDDCSNNGQGPRAIYNDMCIRHDHLVATIRRHHWDDDRSSSRRFESPLCIPSGLLCWTLITLLSAASQVVPPLLVTLCRFLSSRVLYAGSCAATTHPNFSPRGCGGKAPRRRAR